MNSDNVLGETGLTSKIIANYAPKQCLVIQAPEKTEPIVMNSPNPYNMTVQKLEPNIDPIGNGTSFLDSLTQSDDGSRNKVTKMEALFKVTSCELQNFETGSSNDEFKARPHLVKSHSTGGSYPCEPPTSKGRPRKHPYKPGKYQCNYCGALCAKPSVLEKHIRAHTNERPFPCNLCKIDFKTKSNLSKHEKSKSHYLKMEIHKAEPNASSLTQDIKPIIQHDTKIAPANIISSSILTTPSNTSTDNVRKMAMSLVTAASGGIKQDIDFNTSVSDTRSDVDSDDLENDEPLTIPDNINRSQQTLFSSDNTSVIGVLTVASGGETIQVPVQLDSSFFKNVSNPTSQNLNISNNIDPSYNSIRILNSNQDLSSLNNKDIQGMNRSDADLLAAQSILQLASNEKESFSAGSGNLMMQSGDKLGSNSTSLASQQSSWMSQSSTNSFKSVKIHRNSLVSQQAVDQSDQVEIQVVNLSDFSDFYADPLKPSEMLELPSSSQDGEVDNCSPPTLLVTTNKSDQQQRKKTPKLIMIGKNPSLDLEDASLQPQISSSDNFLSVPQTPLNVCAGGGNLHLLKAGSLDSFTLKQSHSLDNAAFLTDNTKKSSFSHAKKFFSQESEPKFSMDSPKGDFQSVKMLLKDKILRRSKSAQPPTEDNGIASGNASVSLMTPNLPISCSPDNDRALLSTNLNTVTIKSQPQPLLSPVMKSSSVATTPIPKPQFIFVSNSNAVQTSIPQSIVQQSSMENCQPNHQLINNHLKTQATPTSSYSSGIAPPPKKRRLDQSSLSMENNEIYQPDSSIYSNAQKLSSMISVSSSSDVNQAQEAVSRDVYFPTQSSNMLDSNVAISLSPNYNQSNNGSALKYYTTFTTSQGQIILMPLDATTPQLNQQISIIGSDNHQEENNVSQTVSTSQLFIDMFGSNITAPMDTMSVGYQTNPLVMGTQMVQLVSNQSQPNQNHSVVVSLPDNGDNKLSMKQEDAQSFIQTSRAEAYYPSKYDSPVTIVTLENSSKMSSMPSTSPTKLAKILPKSEPLEIKGIVAGSNTINNAVSGGSNGSQLPANQYVRGKGRGKYQCPDCGIRCIKPCMLRKHSLIHSSLRPYICDHCDQRFKTKGNLKKHMKSKAHYEKCTTDLKMSEVPTVVNENTQIDHQALNSRMQNIKENETNPSEELCEKVGEDHSSHAASDSDSNELVVDSPTDVDLSRNSDARDESFQNEENEIIKNSETSLNYEKDSEELVDINVHQTLIATTGEQISNPPDNTKNNESAIPLGKSEESGSSSASLMKSETSNPAKSIVKPENHLPPNVNAIEMPQDMPLNLSSARLRHIGKDEDALSKEQAWKHVEAAIKAVNPNLQEEEPALEGIDLLTNNIPAHSVQTNSTSNNQESASSQNRTMEVEQVFSQQKQNGITCELCGKRCETRNYQLHLQVHRFTGEDGSSSTAVASFNNGGGKDSVADGNDCDSSALDANKPQSGSSSTVEGPTDPRPFKCVVCSIGFRVCGHLSKHYRSKTHLNNLASAGLLTTALLSEIESNKVPIHEIIDQETGNLIPQVLSRYVSNKWGRKVADEDANSCSSSTVANSDCGNAENLPIASPISLSETINENSDNPDANTKNDPKNEHSKITTNDGFNRGDKTSPDQTMTECDNEDLLADNLEENCEQCDSPPLIVVTTQSGSH